MYTPNNYHEMAVGEVLKDDTLDSTWTVIIKVPNGAVLRNVGGACMEVTKETCDMCFVPVEV